MYQTRLLAPTIAIALMLSFTAVGVASALTAACSGAPTATNITWTASASDGVAPFAFLWGDGGTTTPRIIAVSPGTYSMTLQATDASSTVATTTCSATVTVTATTTPPSGSLAAQIQALLAQIKVLQAQIVALIAQNTGGGGTATTTPQGCFDFWRDLKHGDIGDDVKELQQQLAHDNPTLFPPGLITGFFGPKTNAALKMFQRRFGIDPEGTGFFGMKSRGFFKDNCGKADTDHDGVRNSDDDDDDNDGTPDVEDSHPHNPNVATSTNMRADDRSNRGENGKKGENNKGKGKGNSGDDDDDEDD